MILWLASYPKSGNTWVRTILGQLFHKNLDNTEVFEKSKNIRLYPSRIDFVDLDEYFKLKKFPQEKKKIIFDKTAINWIKSQSILNLTKDIKILKTHNMLCKLNINNKDTSFTDLDNSIGVIHIVRDPRNVITSLINHFSFNNEKQALRFLKNENQTLGLDQNSIPQLLSSWNNHYNSWKRFPKNNFLIKYEELILNPKKQISSLIDYLKNFFPITISHEEIDKILEYSSFENLKKLEDQGLFDEKAFNITTGKYKKFFYLGPKNDWKNRLKYETLKDIQESFHDEMVELDYL